MNEILRDRLIRSLDALPDDKAYLVLDYIEFLGSKYAERSAGAAPFQKVAETLEDTLRELAKQTGLPCVNPLVDGPGPIIDELLKPARAKRPDVLLVCLRFRCAAWRRCRSRHSGISRLDEYDR